MTNQKLYIVHGWAYSIEPWAATVKLLRDAGITVVQLHVPGLTTESDQVFTIDDYVAWLAGELQDDPHPVVLGHSNGGRIAMHYLARHPSGFSRLILLDSAGIELNGRRISRKRHIVKTAAKILKPLKYIPGIAKITYRLLGSDYGAAPKNMRATLANMLASDRGFDPSFINIPTDILWGADDQVTPVAMGQKLHQLIVGSSLKILPEWQHAPYRTHPEQLAREIRQLIEVNL